MKTFSRSLLFLLALIIAIPQLEAQRRNRRQAQPEGKTYDENLYNKMEWRNVGPFRGGRSTTVTGVMGDDQTYYMGTVGGGVWKTEDAGLSWKNISDKFFNTVSIGAVSVAPSDPNVLYVGTGEAPIRGVMTTSGDGVYKSTDAGKTWKHVGLEKTLHISQVRIHPNNPDVVYVAGQGSPYAPTQDRGVYKTTDGGKSWSKIHFVDANSGVSDLSMDMNNPRILYAAYWDHERKPWYVRSGGPGSGIYKTTDSGETWEKLEKGLPETTMGKIGVSVSQANSNRVYAIIESDEGGLYRSNDGGESWKLMNKERVLRTRSWYYMHIYADPQNEDVVYVMNAPYNKSIDGGKTFVQIPVPHGDNHGLWINPDNNENIINSNDGGANITFNNGKSWSTQRNQPTAQFYRVIADNRYPYWLYAGQQDNSTLATPSRTDASGIDWQHWRAGLGGNEAAHLAFDLDNPEFIYATAITGMITEHTWSTGVTRSIKPYPVFDLGEPSDEMKYRYNWNPPVIVSKHDPDVIYYGSQLLHKSTDRGNSWEEVSPDLTRNDPEHLGLMGGPITNEAAGAEIYHTIMTITESVHSADVIWIGADDGLVHVTRDGGQNWQNVSPPGAGEGIINSIDVSPHDPATAYITLMKYKFNDFTPYAYKTNDFGQTWQRITNGFDNKFFVRVVREDPDRRGLLYAGTEHGLYISFDDGVKWSRFQLNMPVVPITDLIVHQKDLVVATHGRAFWILDDVTPLHQINDEVASADVFLYKPRDVVKTNATPSFRPMMNAGKNPYPGSEIKYYLKSVSEEDSIELKIEILDGGDNVIRTLSTTAEKESDKITKEEGMNVAKWDFRKASFKPSKGVFVPGGNMVGYRVTPGAYKARLTYGDYTQTEDFNVLKDPRGEASDTQIADKKAQLESMESDINDLYESISSLQEVRDQVGSLLERLGEDEEFQDIQEKGKGIRKQVTEVEGKVISPKQETFQDVINFRNMLDGQLYRLLQSIDSNMPPLTKGQGELYNDLKKVWLERKSEVNQILNVEVPAFNQMLIDKDIPHVAPKEEIQKVGS